MEAYEHAGRKGAAKKGVPYKALSNPSRARVQKRFRKALRVKIASVWLDMTPRTAAVRIADSEVLTRKIHTILIIQDSDVTTIC